MLNSIQGRRDSAGRRVRAVQEAVRRALRAQAFRPSAEGDLLGHGVAILQQEAGTHEGSDDSILELCRFRLLKNHDSDSLAVFNNLSGIGTAIGIK